MDIWIFYLFFKNAHIESELPFFFNNKNIATKMYKSIARNIFTFLL